jgi:hypothetical protein
VSRWRPSPTATCWWTAPARRRPATASASWSRCRVLIAADATGWIQPLYPPRLAATSPLAAGTRVFLPSDGQWYALDQNRGAESFYFVASKARLPALEEVLSPFEAGQRPPMLRAQAEPVGEPTEIANGVRTRQPTEAAGPGGEGTLAAQAFLAEPGAGAIVVTRWLLHR